MAEMTQPAEIAREAFRRLAARRLAPTPENYRMLYREIGGGSDAEAFPERELKVILGALPRTSPSQVKFAREIESAIKLRSWPGLKAAIISAAREEVGGSRDWSSLIHGIVSAMERRHVGLTPARKRQALDHVLEASGSDADRLFDRLSSLVESWSQSQAVAVDPPAAQPAVDEPPQGADATQGSGAALRELVAQVIENAIGALLADSPSLGEEGARLAEQFRKTTDGPGMEALVARFRRFAFSLQWVAEDQAELKAALLHLLTLIIQNIRELSSDDQWLHGQIGMLGDLLEGPMNLQRLSDIERRLKDVILRQGSLKQSLDDAKDRLKEMLAGFVDNLSSISSATSGYHDKIGRCAQRISEAKDITELSLVVDEVMRETRIIQLGTQRAHDELADMKLRAEEAERAIVRLQTELVQTSELVRQDYLTGALNRKGLDEALEAELSRSRRRKTSLCVALLDVDNFKRINDEHGHQTGDGALVHLAQVIRETLRPHDTLARYGGEEFVIVIPDASVEEAVEVMRRVQRELTRRFYLHDDQRLLITFSAGVAQIAEGEDREKAIARADAAMYRAKQAGKNRVCAADPGAAPAGAAAA
ncbi:MAG: GGDEF domain-containing protein [Rhodocyclaceae bacterium]